MASPMESKPRPEEAGPVTILFRRYHDRLLRLAVRATRNVLDAEDALQQTLYKLLKRVDEAGWTSFGADVDLEQFADPGSPSSRRLEQWLRNDLLRTLHRLWKKQEFERNWILRFRFRLRGQRRPRPDRAAALHEKWERLMRVLAALPPVEAEVLILSAEGRTYPEMAEILGLSVGMVGHKLTAARAHARDLYRKTRGWQGGVARPAVPIPAVLTKPGPTLAGTGDHHAVSDRGPKDTAAKQPAVGRRAPRSR